jgi:hypothetical protein
MKVWNDRPEKSLIRRFDFDLKNIFVEASTSGKMTKNHFRRFYKHISGVNIDERALLPVDSRADNKVLETMKLALQSKNVCCSFPREQHTKSDQKHPEQNFL